VKRPRLIVIAGCNGAGKTTFAKEFLPNEANCLRFLNADLIAAGLSPLAPALAARQAGKTLLLEFRSLVRRRQSFAVESTLSGKTLAPLLKRARRSGFAVTIHFLFIPSSKLALARVRERVRKGGHDVPENDVRRRFVRGLENFAGLYAPIAHRWLVWDNRSSPPVLAADSGRCPVGDIPEVFAKLQIYHERR
jgi:predicted ABC-type ATPase